MEERASGAVMPADLERALRELRPVAVLLHGSRAAGKERPGSDWDLCVLVEDVCEPCWRTQQVGDVALDLDIVPVKQRTA